MTAGWMALVISLCVVVVGQGVILFAVLKRSSGVVDQIDALFSSVRLSDLFKPLPVGTYVASLPPAQVVQGASLGRPAAIQC